MRRQLLHESQRIDDGWARDTEDRGGAGEGKSMNVLESANLVLRFALEIGALVTVGSWGWHAGSRSLDPWSFVPATRGKG
jgi:hypothetical protein